MSSDHCGVKHHRRYRHNCRHSPCFPFSSFVPNLYPPLPLFQLICMCSSTRLSANHTVNSCPRQRLLDYYSSSTVAIVIDVFHPFYLFRRIPKTFELPWRRRKHSDSKSRSCREKSRLSRPTSSVQSCVSHSADSPSVIGARYRIRRSFGLIVFRRFSIEFVVEDPTTRRNTHFFSSRSSLHPQTPLLPFVRRIFRRRVSLLIQCPRPNLVS